MVSALELETRSAWASFHVDGVPQPKGSMRSFFAGGRIVLTDQNRALKPWAATIRKAASATRVTCHDADVPVSVELRFVLPRPTSLVKRVQHPIRKRSGDIDKLTRGVLDALTGVCYVDDSQVITLRCSKRFVRPDEQPGMTVWVRAYDGQA